MANVGNIELVATIDTSSYKRGAKDIDQANDNIARGSENTAARSDQAWKSFSSNVVKYAAIAGAALVAASTAAAVKSIKNYINLQESINAVEKTFGDSTNTILEWGETAETQAGLSRAAFNSAIIPIGAMLQNMGVDQKEAADQSINLARRAADLASVFNTDLDQAITAIQAGLRGEADPLERFGVGLSEASVQAYAVANGVSEAGKEMTAQQKTVARLGLFFEQTNRYAGDFVDTSDQAANKSRILQARLENLSAGLGQKLMPAYDRLLSVGEYLLDNTDEITRGFQSALPTVITLAAGVGGYSAVLGILQAKTAAMTTAQLALNLAMRVNPIGLLVGAATAITVAYMQATAQTDRNKDATVRLEDARNLLTDATNRAKDAENLLKDAQLGAEGASLRVEGAQRRYNQALNDYGPESYEARIAAHDLKLAQDDLATANDNVKNKANDAREAQTKINDVKEVIKQANAEIAGSAYGVADSYKSLTNRVQEAQVEMSKTSTRTGVSPIDSLVPKIGGRASGGPVSAGSPYFVGENADGSLNKTSELFVPDRSGRIINSKDLQSALGSSGRNVEYNIGTITISSEVDGERWLRKLTGNQEIVSNGLVPRQAYM